MSCLGLEEQVRLRFLEDKAFSRDGVTVVRVRSGEEAEVPPRLAARYLEEGVAVDAGEVKARAAAPENKATMPPAEAPSAPVVRRGGRRKAVG